MNISYCIVSIAILAILSVAGQADKIYGPVIGSLSTLQHEVRGKVHALNLNTIGLRNFSYDGLGQEAFFWIGDDASGPNAKGRQVLDERGSISPLKTYRDATLVLILPDGSTLQTIKYIAVWDAKTSTNYGSVSIPADLVIPREIQIGSFMGKEHGVSSGPVTILDSRTILIQEFSYDGQGPEAFFWVGTGVPNDKGIMIPNEVGSLDKLSAYTKKNITLLLPEGLNVYNIDYLSVWCLKFTVNFGHIVIPRNNITVPPFVAREVFIPVPNREEMPGKAGANGTAISPQSSDAKTVMNDVGKEAGRLATVTNATPSFTESITVAPSAGSDKQDVQNTTGSKQNIKAATAADASKTGQPIANDGHPAAVLDESSSNATELFTPAAEEKGANLTTSGSPFDVSAQNATSSRYGTKSTKAPATTTAAVNPTTIQPIANDGHPAAVIDESNGNLTEPFTATGGKDVNPTTSGSKKTSDSSAQPEIKLERIPALPPSNGDAKDNNSSTTASDSQKDSASSSAKQNKKPSPSIADLAAAVASGRHRISTSTVTGSDTKLTTDGPFTSTPSGTSKSRDRVPPSDSNASLTTSADTSRSDITSQPTTKAA